MGRQANAANREAFRVAVDGGRVIAGVSGSLRSLGALRAGVEEARLTGAPLMAVLAWEPAGGELAYRRAPCPILLKLWQHAAVERLTSAFHDAFGGIPQDVTVRMLVVRGKAGPFLVDFADQPDDLLVVGCGGGRWLRNSLHGSVTRYCIAHAHCPVLTIPPPELIRQVRSRPHRWRPEDFAAPLGERASRGAGRARRHAAQRPSRAKGPVIGPASGLASGQRGDASDLPAYRGAPYYQPGPPSRRARTLRRIRLALHPLSRDAAGRADRRPARPEPAVAAGRPPAAAAPGGHRSRLGRVWSARLEDRDVHVVVVVRGDAAAIGHGDPAGEAIRMSQMRCGR